MRALLGALLLVGCYPSYDHVGDDVVIVAGDGRPLLYKAADGALLSECRDATERIYEATGVELRCAPPDATGPTRYIQAATSDELCIAAGKEAGCGVAGIAAGGDVWMVEHEQPGSSILVHELLHTLGVLHLAEQPDETFAWNVMHWGLMYDQPITGIDVAHVCVTVDCRWQHPEEQ